MKCATPTSLSLLITWKKSLCRFTFPCRVHGVIINRINDRNLISTERRIRVAIEEQLRNETGKDTIRISIDYDFIRASGGHIEMPLLIPFAYNDDEGNRQFSWALLYVHFGE